MSKGKRHTEEQIIGILKQADAGLGLQDLCRQFGISHTTFYKWKAKFGGMDVSDAKRLRSLDDENRKLKTIVADLILDNKVLKELLSKKF
jgi:putative transposase